MCKPTTQGGCRLLLLDNLAAYVRDASAAVTAAAAAATAAARATAAGVGSPRGGCGMLSPTWQQQHPLGPQGQQPTAASSRTYAAATTAHASSTGSAVDVTRLHSAIAALLRALSHKLRCPVIVSKSARVSRQERDGRPILTQQEPMTVSWEVSVRAHATVYAGAAAAAAVSLHATAAAAVSLHAGAAAAGTAAAAAAALRCI